MAKNSRINHNLTIILALLTIGSGCSKQIDSGVELESLMKTDREFAKLSLEKGATDAFYEYLTEGAIMLSNGSHPLFGRESIYEDMSDDPDYVLSWEPAGGGVSSEGDMGYTWGYYKATTENEGGEANISYGKYLNVWRKQPDGSWRVKVDMGNNSPSPLAGESAKGD